MKIEKIRVFGFEPAIQRGMRNPMDSWRRSDSLFYELSEGPRGYESPFGFIRAPEHPVIGPADMELACKLIRRGTPHDKFLRQIRVWVDLTLPRYVWQELDTYKVSTTRNSCSTMNKLGSSNLEQSDFQLPIKQLTLDDINALGQYLREAKKNKTLTESGTSVKDARRKLKNDLPEGFLQKATYDMSYATVISALLQRERHRLPEWNLQDEGSICQFLMALPFVPQFYRAAILKRNLMKDTVNQLDAIIDDFKSGLGLNVESLQDVRTTLKKIS